MIVKIDGLFEFYLGRLGLGRLAISERGKYNGAREKRFDIVEAPGYWYIELWHWRISWKRKWMVWGDGPCRRNNIKHYDQFGTYQYLKILALKQSSSETIR